MLMRFASSSARLSAEAARPLPHPVGAAAGSPVFCEWGNVGGRDLYVWWLWS